MNFNRLWKKVQEQAFFWATANKQRKIVFLVKNTFEELADDAQLNITEKVTRFDDEQPVKALALSAQPLHVKISNPTPQRNNRLPLPRRNITTYIHCTETTAYLSRAEAKLLTACSE